MVVVVWNILIGRGESVKECRVMAVQITSLTKVSCYCSVELFFAGNGWATALSVMVCNAVNKLLCRIKESAENCPVVVGVVRG